VQEVDILLLLCIFSVIMKIVVSYFLFSLFDFSS
jgi:hypothetical protein